MVEYLSEYNSLEGEKNEDVRFFVINSEPGEGGIAALILAAGMLVSMVVGYAWGSYICQRLNILPLKPKKGREVERKN